MTSSDAPVTSRRGVCHENGLTAIALGPLVLQAGLFPYETVRAAGPRHHDDLNLEAKTAKCKFKKKMPKTKTKRKLRDVGGANVWDSVGRHVRGGMKDLGGRL